MKFQRSEKPFPNIAVLMSDVDLYKVLVMVNNLRKNLGGSDFKIFKKIMNNFYLKKTMIMKKFTNSIYLVFYVSNLI